MNVPDDLLVMDDETTLAELPDFVERLTQVNLREAAALMANAGASPARIAANSSERSYGAVIWTLT